MVKDKKKKNVIMKSTRTIATTNLCFKDQNAMEIGTVKTSMIYKTEIHII